ncbi:MAG: tetratricopeptide repeat-containing sulfotransferase family protein, partial [Rubripirellula sp.]
QGQEDRAVACFENATLFGVEQSEPALALAALYRNQRKLSEAIHTLRVALTENRRSAKLNLALAGLLRRRARVLDRRRMPLARRKVLDEARRCYLTALEVEPTADGCLQFGIFEQAMGYHEASTSLFRRAGELDPNSVAVIAQLANASIDNGNIDEGLRQYERVLRESPEMGIAHFRYTRAKRFRPGTQTDLYVEQLQGLLADPKQREPARIHFHFSIAKVFDDIGEYDQAWHHYDQANRLKPAHSQSRSTRAPVAGRSSGRPLHGFAEVSKSVFTREYFGQKPIGGSDSRVPVFIIGMPRSGTTLTEQILSSHPDVAGAGELKWIDRLQRDLIAELDSVDGTSSLAARSQRQNHDQSRTAAKTLPRLAELPQLYLERIAADYLGTIDGFRQSEKHVTDKMPTNFMHLGMIARMFPNATVVQCQRNPMDVLVSNYCQNLNAPFCDMDQLVAYYETYCRLMDHWKSVLPITIHVVKYERLVSDTESHCRALLDHCQLPWAEECLDFHRNERAVRTPSKWQVRQPLYATSVEKWRRFEPQLRGVAARVAEIGETPVG